MIRADGHVTLQNGLMPVCASLCDAMLSVRHKHKMQKLSR